MAIQFNGTNQGTLSISANSLLQNVASCTFMAWIYPTTFPGVTSGVIQVGINPSGGLSRGNLLIKSNGTLRMGGRAPDSGSLQSIDSTNAVSLGTWSHVVGILDFTNDTGQIYINGVSSAVTGTLGFINALTDNTTSWSHNLGSDESNSNEFYNGAIDDARVYHRILSAVELETIYACRGTDTIVESLQYRYAEEGPEGNTVGALSTPAVNNPSGSLSSSSGSTLNLSYTVPAGSDLVLVVAGTAEDNNDQEASSATFGSTSMTKINSTVTSGSSSDVGVALFYLSVTGGSSGTITITWPASVDRRTLHAYTLSGVQATPEENVTAINNSGNATASITTATDGAIIVSAGVNRNANALSAVGTDHSVNDSQVTSGHAGAMGNVTTTTAGNVTGIGFTSSSTSRMAIALAAFPPASSPGSIYDLSDNKINSLVYNLPTYVSAPLKLRRNSKA